MPGRARHQPDELEVIIVGTVTPDMMYPSTACLVQNKLGASERLGLRRLGRMLWIYLCSAGRREAGGKRRALARFWYAEPTPTPA